MAKGNSSSSSGIGFFGLLTVVFITLKLTGVVTWSWWWVLAPLWAPAATALGVLAVGLIGSGVVIGGAALVMFVMDRIVDSRRRRLGE